MARAAEPREVSTTTLALMAIGGVVAYHLASMAPFAAFLFANPLTVRWGPWPPICVLAILWWAVRPAFHLPGRAVTRGEAAALFDAVDALADGIGAPRVEAIRLDDAFNAGAMEIPSRRHPWRRQRVLVLGLPLLALADADMVRSVIAHELGHFSHRHGRLGHWVYRARAGWLEFDRGAVDRAPLYWRASAAFARWFTPRFARLSAAYSRRCEFEADAFGAAVVGPQAMAAGLLAIAVFDDRWARATRDRLPDLVAAQPAPPDSWLAVMQATVLTHGPLLEEWERLRSRAAAEHDSHPSLGERIAALGMAGETLLRAASLPERSAGQVWLPDWPARVAAHDAAWARAQAPRWQCMHIHRRHVDARLARLRAEDDTGIERARLALSQGAFDEVDALAPAWQDVPPCAAEAAYLRGAARLALGDAAGIALLETSIRLDPAWALPARTLIDGRSRLLPDEAARARNRALLEQAVRRRLRARQQMRDAILAARLAPARLDPVAEAVLREALAVMPEVAAAWCAGFDGLRVLDRRFDGVALILRLRTDRLQGEGPTEDDLRRQTRALLDDVLPATAVGLVWTAYTTEPLSTELDALLAAWAAPAAAGCLVGPVPGESVEPGVRATALG